MAKNKTDAGERFSRSGALDIVLSEINNFLSMMPGREPKAITYGNADPMVSISFILKPKSGSKVWKFNSSPDWTTLNLTSSKEATTFYVEGIPIHVGLL